MTIEQKLKSRGYIVSAPFVVLGQERVQAEKPVGDIGIIYLTYTRDGKFCSNNVMCNWADIQKSTQIMGVSWADIEAIKHMT